MGKNDMVERARSHGRTPGKSDPAMVERNGRTPRPPEDRKKKTYGRLEDRRNQGCFSQWCVILVVGQGAKVLSGSTQGTYPRHYGS